MTDRSTSQKQSNRIFAIGILSVLLGITFLWISTHATGQLVFVIGSERIDVPTISLLEIPSFSVSGGAPIAGEDVSLTRRLADKIETALYVIFLALHAIGGFLVIIGAVILVSAVTHSRR